MTHDWNLEKHQLRIFDLHVRSEVDLLVKNTSAKMLSLDSNRFVVSEFETSEHKLKSCEILKLLALRFAGKKGSNGVGEDKYKKFVEACHHSKSQQNNEELFAQFWRMREVKQRSNFF